MKKRNHDSGIESLRSLLEAPHPAFLCRERQELSELPFLAPVRHRVGKRATSAELRAARQAVGPRCGAMLEFYAQSNGLILFEQTGTGVVGLRLYPMRQWKTANQNTEIWEWRSGRKSSAPDGDAVVFGEVPNSGNYLAIRPSGPRAGEVILFDHEVGPAKRLAGSFDGFLEFLVRRDPVKLLNDSFGSFARYRNPRTRQETAPAEYHPDSRLLPTPDGNRLRLQGEPMSILVPKGWTPPRGLGTNAILNPEGQPNGPAAIHIETGLSFRTWYSPAEEMQLFINTLGVEKIRWRKPVKVAVQGNESWQSEMEGVLDYRDVMGLGHLGHRLWKVRGRATIVRIRDRGFKAACYASTPAEQKKTLTEYRSFLDTLQYDPAFVAAPPPSALVDLTSYGDLKSMSRLLASGADPNDRDEMGMSALCRAIQTGAVEGVRLLLKHGASPNEPAMASRRRRGRNEPDSSVLATAIKSECCPAEVVEVLLKHGADPNLESPDGLPLCVAVSSVDYDYNADTRLQSIVQSLLRHSADPNLEYKGMSALAMAREEGMRKIVNWMTRRPGA